MRARRARFTALSSLRSDRLSSQVAELRGRLNNRRMNLTYQVAANLGRHSLSTCPVASDFRGPWTSTRAGKAGSQAVLEVPGYLASGLDNSRQLAK